MWIYLDNQLIGSGKLSNNDTLNTTPTELHIGHVIDNSSNLFKGRLDDIRLMSCSMNSTQIDSLWKAECVPFYTSDSISINNGDSAEIGGQYYISSGIYNDTLVASTGCDSIVAVTLNVETGCTFSLFIMGAINNSCYQSCDGAVFIMPMGGTPPYAAIWSNGMQGPNPDQLCAGVYTVSVQDGNGCTGGTSVTISEPGEIISNLSITNSTCGNNDGSANTNVTGGIPPYTYQWTSGDTTTVADSLYAGTYLLRIEDSEGCEINEPVAISDSDGPQLSATKNDVTCFGLFDGAINLNVSGGATPYSFAWSNGETSQNISNLQAGPYEVDVADANGCIGSLALAITEPSEIIVSGNVSNTACGSSNGSITSTVDGGTSPYSYNWSNGSSSPTLTGLSAGLYGMTVNDVNGCEGFGNVAISEIGSPIVTIDSVLSIGCGGTDGAVYITPVFGSSSYTFNWSNGSTSKDIVNQPSGDYSVTVTSANGCSTILSTEIEGAIDTPKVCIVTVDTSTHNNVVVWNKQYNRGIAEYNVYKESTSANLYFLAGTVPFDSTSVFVDSMSNPLTRSWRYRISAVDSCGNESAPSPIHKTIHLAMNLGLGNSINLIWDDYEGFAYGTYYINRFKFGTGWETIDSIPSNLTSYTDASPPLGNLWYGIEVKHPDGCDPDQFKASNYSTSRSNRPTSISTGEDTTTTDTTGTNLIREFQEGRLIVYPNPASEILTVVSEKTYNAVLYNTLGVRSKDIRIQSGLNRIDVSELSSGVYFIHLSDPGIEPISIVVY